MKTILVVDDSASMRAMLAHVLSSGGYTVLEAASAEDALAIAAAQPVDAVITDHHMSGMDGIALVRRLRTSPSHARTPVMLLTTESAAELKRAAREAGATGWMVKPFDPERLLAMFAKLVGEVAR